jgi:hypothetical protein
MRISAAGSAIDVLSLSPDRKGDRMRQAKRALAFAALLLSGLAAACGDLPVVPTQAEAGGAARLFSAPSVTISGLDYVVTGTSYTWHANASGGNGTYTYQWEERNTGSWFQLWTPAGTGSSLTRYFGFSETDLELRVTVTSAGSSASAVHHVQVIACCP